MSRSAYKKGQRDGSKNRYKLPGKDPMWAGITGWSSKDSDTLKSYNLGYRNGKKNPSR